MGGRWLGLAAAAAAAAAVAVAAAAAASASAPHSLNSPTQLTSEGRKNLLGEVSSAWTANSLIWMRYPHTKHDGEVK